MLADDLLDYLPFDRPLQMLSGDFASEIAGHVQRANRYVLTQSALEVIVAIARGRLSSVLKALPLVKTIEPIWIEYAYGDEVSARNVIGARPSDARGMQRLGYLAVPTAPDGSQLSIYHVQKSRNTPTGVGLQQAFLRVSLDTPWSELTLPRHGIARPFGGEAERILKDCYWGPEGGWQAADDAAARTLVRHTYADVLPGHLEYIQTALNGGGFSMDDIAKLTFSLIIPFATMMALLRTRNRVVVEKSELTKLNRQRAKSGSVPLLDYSVVKVSLTRERAAYRGYQPTGGGLSVESRRGCLVEAHYKVRKTGIFLWHEHPRRGFGDPKPKTFVVVA